MAEVGKAVVPPIVVTIRLQASVEGHRELLQTVQSLLAPIRSQRGCLGLRLYSELGGDAALCLIEEWATEGDLNEHLRSNYFSVLLGASRMLLKKTSELEFRLLTPTAGMEVVEAIHGRTTASTGETKVGT